MAELYNRPQTILPHGVYVGQPSPNIFELDNPGCRGIQLYIALGPITGTGSLTVTLEGKDPVSGQPFTILASAAILAASANSLIVLKVYPGLTAVNNLVANDCAPRKMRVKVTHSDGGSSFDYSIGASGLV